MNTLLGLSLVSGPLVIGVYAIGGAALLLLAAAFVRARRTGRRRRLALTVAVLLVGLLGGVALAALVDGTDGPFGVDFTPVTRVWIGLGLGGLALVAIVLVHALSARRLRRALASLGVGVLVVATAAMAVNIDFGQYPTVRSALGISAYPTVADPVPTPSGDHPSLADWTPPADMPAVGTVSTVTIPATASNFSARDAVVYLPPAALTADPPLLPVMVMLSGQPGVPSDPLSTENLQKTLDDYAAAHAGLAPIVVSPDQLGDPSANPMCVDSPLGASATYLTVDVPNWIRANLPVLGDAHDWAIGGLSQGGTCAIQLGAGYPQLFGNIIDASGELAPTLGDDATTIEKGFGGSAAAYEAAKPASLLAENAPYADSFAVFGVGANDAAFVDGVKTLYADAQAAGMQATYIEVPDSAHDVTAWSTVFDKGLELLVARWNLVPAS
ncbi:Enterochelin esterase [Rathayibacter oskolensis]|uniref:Enterochelin esterase n=1 Tax=Rathayibacter oskolensis TaxID=1891671 RepID=A0A1X7MVM8_9MICO|nr:alpha/beta hydrolase-fold protein [Rathayibacter oskolensis]SMH27983.1 Enterochelin esterase [Rathayibacter oskolensis]